MHSFYYFYFFSLSILTRFVPVLRPKMDEKICYSWLFLVYMDIKSI